MKRYTSIRQGLSQFAILCLVLVYGDVAAQETLWTQTNGPVRGSVTEFRTGLDEQLFVRASGQIYRSLDDGRTWHETALHELHEFLSSAIYSFDGNASCPTMDDDPSVDDAPYVAFSSFFREGVECELGEGVFRSKAWPEADERQSGHYIGFSITPHIDASVNLSGHELSFLLRRSLDGPKSVALTYRFWRDDSLYVLDEFGLDDTEELDLTVALPDTTTEAPIEFHWYAWNASSQGGYLQIDDVRVGLVPGSLGVDENAAVPTGLSLVSSYPNPFNPTTTVTLVNSRSQHVTLAAYDVLGRRLAVLYEGMLPPDHHEFKFDASDLAGGVYWMIAQGEAGHGATAVLLSK